MILLDTHLVLWLAFEPARLSRAASARIKEARRQSEVLAISNITLLEIARAASKGRLQITMSVESFLQSVESRFAVLPITSQACAKTLELPASYPKDPADRIIGATAIVEGIPLITADTNIRKAKGVRTIW